MSRLIILVRRKCVVVTGVSAVFGLMFLLHHSGLVQINVSLRSVIVISNNGVTVINDDSVLRHRNSSELLVLQWTTFFGMKNWMAQEGMRITIDLTPSNGSMNAATNRSCIFTSDRRRLADADYVIFHARDYSESEMPPVRYTSNRWVFFSAESPLNSMTPMAQRTAFNFSFSFRHDADFPDRYGRCTALTTLKEPISESLLRTKSKLVATMISNCATHSQREAFIEELRRYIPIDMYGSCGKYEAHDLSYLDGFKEFVTPKKCDCELRPGLSWHQEGCPEV